MSDPVLSQLVSVESDLATQAEELEAQLKQLQEQRQGLRTVIDMFDGSGQPIDIDTSAIGAGSTTTKKKPGRKPGRKPSSATKSKSTAAKTDKKTTSKATRKTGGRKKKDGRAANWQKYVKSEYRDEALPEAVSSVLRSQPSEIFKIADVMTAIFKEDMPRSSYLKARNRISNILSGGARDGTWYRGRNGRYSQSESVTKVK